MTCPPFRCHKFLFIPLAHEAHSDFQDWQARAGDRRGAAGDAGDGGVIAHWVERLKTELAADGGGAVEVKGAAALAQALADLETIKKDSVYVLYAAEDADGNIQAGAVRQRCVIGVTVALAVANRQDRRDEAGLEEVETLHGRVREALLGWAPPGATERVEYRRGRLLNFTEGAQVWADDYEMAGWITQPAATV